MERLETKKGTLMLLNDDQSDYIISALYEDELVTTGKTQLLMAK